MVIFTPCKRSLGQGNVFTPVCHSVYRMHHRSHDRGGLCRGGPPEYINKRAVRILLAYILVLHIPCVIAHN